jgi:hypothetical protein
VRLAVISPVREIIVLKIFGVKNHTERPLLAQSGHAPKDLPQPIANFGSLFKQYESGSYRHRYLSPGTEIEGRSG